MGRWAPDACGRLEHAAFELYAERGFEATTVAAIAERAGLTERTFFRNFADKREVLFSGFAALQTVLVEAIAAAPAGPPMQLVVGAFDRAAVCFFDSGPAYARRRQAVIAASPELQERELVKLSGLSTAVTAALREHGVVDPAATLAAETGMAVFRVALDLWLADPADAPLSDHLRVAVAAFAAL